MDERQEAFAALVDDPLWRIEIEGFDPLREREMESWFTVANGRSGTRGSLEEESEESSAATYVAALYGWPDGGDPPGPELVTGPRWTRLAPRAGAEAIDLDRGELLEHRRILDLQQAILFRIWRHRLPSGVEVGFRSARFASMADREVLALEAEARSAGPAVRLGDGVPPPDLGPVESVKAGREGGRLVMSFQARGGRRASFAISTLERDGRLRRIAAVSRGGDPVGRDAVDALEWAERDGLPRVRARHTAAWRERWRDSDVVVDGDPEAQRALRFALYHLMSAGDPESDLASIGARGLTGDGYRGHLFWDTEVFMVPFFTYTHPETARTLLAHRHRTLPAARARAAAFGYRGALFAWECADTGEETTPGHEVGPDGTRIPILTSQQEHHISADVAWASWRHWEATGDEAFLADIGAEIVLETARFWASRARRGRDGRHHIARVMGPDEYHQGVRDNAFTNIMARWNLERALEVAEVLPVLDRRSWRALRRRMALEDSELRRWRTVAGGLVDGFDPGTGLYEQFAGFFDLEDVRAADLGPRPFVAELVMGRDRLGRSQVVKQADVAMVLHMVPEVVPAGAVRANYRYYEPRTSHGSSLSPAIHAAVAARVGRPADALRYFEMAAAIDLGNRMGNAAHGIHMAAMGGLWQAAVLGFGGLRADGDALRIDPRPPRTWTRLAFPLRWRGSRVRVDVEARTVTVTVDRPTPVAIGANAPRRLNIGRHLARKARRGWSSLEEVRPS